MKKVLAAMFASMILAVPAANAAGSVANGTLTVSATVTPACTVNSPTLNFGTYNGTLDQVTTNIVVTCTATGATGTVSIDGTVGSRVMTSGTNTLAYELYTDAAYTPGQEWGSTSTPTMPLDPTSTTTTLTVYGQIAAGLPLAGGNYSDTRIITVNY